MRLIVVGAHVRGRQPRWSSPRAVRHGLWVLLALGSAGGCTLTAESFEPGLMGREQGAGAADTAGDPASIEPGSPDGSTVPMRGSGEATQDPTDLARNDTTDDELDTTSSGAGAAPGDGEDAGSQSVDVPASAPDAAAPDLPVEVPEPCPGQTFEESCYEFFAEPTPWNDAELRCVARGGHLASVESPAEDAFLETWTLVLGVAPADGTGIWLGGTDAAQDGEFAWSDGSALVFDNFAPNQPDNGAGIDCIEKRNDGAALWYDRRCTDAMPYVCEKPL